MEVKCVEHKGQGLFVMIKDGDSCGAFVLDCEDLILLQNDIEQVINTILEYDEDEKE